MTTAKQPLELGLYIRRIQRHHEPHARYSVAVVRKSDCGRSIRNVSDSVRSRLTGKHQKRTYEDFVIEGWVSDYSARVVCGEPRYQDAHWIELPQAELILRTLRDYANAVTRWSKRPENRCATPQATDHFAIMAEFVGASFVVYQDCTRTSDFSYDDRNWRFLSVEDGIQSYLDFVLTLEAQADQLVQAKGRVA